LDTPTPKWHLWLLVAVVAISCGSGCRHVEKVHGKTDLPLQSWDRDLFLSEGVFVYATSHGAAREIAEVADRTTASFRDLTGEEPRHLVYIAVDDGDPLDSKMLESGLHGLARISGKSVPEIRTSMLDEARSQGNSESDGEQGEEEEAVFRALLGMIPGIVPAPDNFPDHLWRDAVLLPTRARINGGFDEILRFYYKRESIGMMKQLLIAPVIPIIRTYLHRFLEAIQDSIVIGVHAQGREGWSQERIDQLFQKSLKASGLDDFRMKIGEESNPDSPEEADETTPPITS